MMKKTITLVGMLATCLMARGATTNTFYVAAGATLTVDQIVAASNFTFAAGDWLRKTGPGTLNAVTTYASTQLNILIEEGVYSVDRQAHSKSGTLIIKNGATLMHSNFSNAFAGEWNVSFEGNGTGVGDNLGAICVRGSNTNAILGNSGMWTMTGDATIYTIGTGNPLFSGTGPGPDGGPTLNMQKHTLTLLGKEGVAAMFRPRWRWGLNNPGHIVVRRCMFARHDTTNDFSSNIPLITFLEGASMDTYGTSSIWGKVNAFEFEAGTAIKKGSNGQTGVALTMKKVTGPVDISSAITVTISQEFGVRGTDMANGDKLTSANALTFADGCKLSVTNWGAVSLSPGTTHTVATSSAGIVGTPVPDGAAAPVFTVANTGNAITLTVKGGIIDVVRDWGVQTGVENAAANTAAVAAHVAEVADGSTIYFPAGDYWFTDTFDLSSVTASGVTVWNPEKLAVLHSGIALGAAANVTVRGVVFKECPGPAVVATGTTGLAIDGCVVDHVTGAYAGGHYPFAAVNVTGFNLTGTTWKADEAIWDGQAYFDGGTQEDLSEAYAGAIVMYVPRGIWLDHENHDWAFWSDVTNKMLLTAAAYNGKTLRKTGTGTLDPDVDLATLGIAAVEVIEGQYVARDDNNLGVAKGPVHVWNGASLTVAGVSKVINSRTVTVSGAGIGGQNPAVRFSGSAVWDKTDHATWVLEGDTTMYAASTGENGTFLWGAINMNGHHLTLNGIAGSHYRFGRSFSWNGGGTVTVSRATLSASSAAKGDYKISQGLAPKFFFTNSAKFVPDDGNICDIVKDCDFAVGTQIAPKYADVPVTFTNLTGAPTGTVKATTITVAGKYTARSAEVSAGTHAIFAGALAFGANATVELDDPSIQMNTYTLFTAEGGITGKPVTTGATAAADWSVFKRGANTLCIGPMPGTVLIVR